MNFVKNMLRIRRIEFMIAEIPIFLIPIVVASRTVESVDRLAIGLGVLVFFLLFNFGDMTNCLADRELDAIYKPQLSRAVLELGTRFVTAQIVLTALAALGVTVFLAERTDHWLLVPLVVIGLMLGAAYSLEPVRLKGRGLLQLACLWLIIFVGPMIFMATLITPLPSTTLLVIAIAYATVQMGIVLLNTAEDYPEDRDARVHTIIVAIGLERGIALAKWMVLAGGIALIAGLGFSLVLAPVSPSSCSPACRSIGSRHASRAERSRRRCSRCGEQAAWFPCGSPASRGRRCSRSRYESRDEQRARVSRSLSLRVRLHARRLSRAHLGRAARTAGVAVSESRRRALA
jgi:4-hydroxybenzoate polyprenyltransferase